MELQDNNGQPAMDPSSSTNQPEAGGNNTVDMTAKVTLGDGSQVSIEDLTKGYLRQSDYTKKTQELSEKKKELNLSDEDLKTIDNLKKAGFATADDILNFKKEQADKESLSNFKSNVNLSDKHMKMVQDLKKVNPEKDYLDIAKEYGLINESALNKTKGST